MTIEFTTQELDKVTEWVASQELSIIELDASNLSCDDNQAVVVGEVTNDDGMCFELRVAKDSIDLSAVVLQNDKDGNWKIVAEKEWV